MDVTCHCKNIAIRVKPPSEVTSCNCSICSRYHTLWGYYPPDEVEIVAGDKGEAFYIWGDRMLEFVRCTDCGCVTHYRTVSGDSNPKIAVNFRMVPEESIAGISVRYFNGKELL